MAIAAAAKIAPMVLDKTIIQGLIDAPSITGDRGVLTGRSGRAEVCSEYQITTNHFYPAPPGLTIK
jgi:hypothetical protein